MRDHHRSRAARFIIAVAGVTFIWSFFLPASSVLEAKGTPPGTPLSGWQAFLASLNAIHQLVILAEPKTLMFLVAPLINALMVVMPLIALIAPESGTKDGIPLLSLAFAPLFFPFAAMGDLYKGF